MKKQLYKRPEVLLCEIAPTDVITASGDYQTPIVDDDE